MKKNLRVVQINGFRGLLIAMFIVSCLIAGFVAFPAFVAMNSWNYLAKTGSLPSINFGEGLLLWAILALSVFLFSKRRFIVSFNAQQELSEEEVKNVVSRIKSQTPNKNIIIPKEFTKDFTTNLMQKENPEEEIKTESGEKN